MGGCVWLAGKLVLWPVILNTCAKEWTWDAWGIHVMVMPCTYAKKWKWDEWGIHVMVCMHLCKEVEMGCM